MKRKLILPIALCVLILAACTDLPAVQSSPPPAAPSVSATIPAPAETPVLLGISDLDAALADLDFSDATLTRYKDEREDGSYPAAAAICAADHADELRSFMWEEYEPVPALREGDSGYRYRLVTADATLTSFQNPQGIRLVTESGEGWFTLPDVDDGPYAWMIYDAFELWYQEAETATKYRGDGTPLTAEELEWFRNYTASMQDSYDEEGEYQYTGTTPISCFFTSKYGDPRDMDAVEFLRYCPSSGNLGVEDEAEFQLIQAKLDWRGGEDDHLLSLAELPVPCHRLSRTYIDSILMQYAGITVEEMNTDWREKALYIPETDCFYTFTSDFGPGAFAPRYGEAQGDTVTLWAYFGQSDNAANALTLQSSGENWHIRLHQPVAPKA